MKRILITAFEPFGGDGINPTQRILERLPEELCGAKLDKLLLPVEFGRAADMAVDEALRLSPAAVICLGQAGGRRAITPELRAVNRMEARIPDNAGFEPHGEPVTEGGPETIQTRLPVWDIIAHIRALGLPAEISYSAGEYVCNSLMYGVLFMLHESVPAGFIHVPFIREQTENVPGRESTPFMELDELITGAEAAIKAVLRRIR